MSRKALVVANDAYADSALTDLRSPLHDAEALAAVLGDPAIGNFEVAVARNASVQQLRERLEEFFSDARPGDELLLHFSCHGLKDESNELYLAASDTRPTLLASTGLAADFIAKRMRASRARSVALLLDCCYGGAFERGMLARAGGDVSILDSFAFDQVAEGAGRVVITASSAVEFAFDGSDLAEAQLGSPSVFTSAVVDGISSGEADSDGSGTIDVNELFHYAEGCVRRINPNQTPHMWSFGTRGNIIVARSPLRHVLPSPLPLAVQTALAGDLFSRIGAVHVLSGMLVQTDPSTVLTAVEALSVLRNDDSKSLSDAATVALRQVQLTATPTAVNLELPVHSPPPHAEITLGGSSLAVAARVVSSPDWLQVRQIGERLLLTVEVEVPNAGTLTIQGPTGTLDVPVTSISREQGSLVAGSEVTSTAENERLGVSKGHTTAGESVPAARNRSQTQPASPRAAKRTNLAQPRLESGLKEAPDFRSQWQGQSPMTGQRAPQTQKVERQRKVPGPSAWSRFWHWVFYGSSASR